MRKTFTALITMLSVIALVGFASMAYATVAPATDIIGKAAITEEKAIGNANSVSADQMVAKDFILKKTEKADAQTNPTLVVAETVPKYVAINIDGTAVVAMKAGALMMKHVMVEGTVPRTLTGRFSGAASITGSEMVVKIDRKIAGAAFTLV